MRKKQCISKPSDVFQYLKTMRSLKKEHLHGLYLDCRNRVIYDEVISIGTLTSNIVHPREVFRPAIEHSAAAVIVAHNHPSGDPHPSEEDIKATGRLKEAGKILSIPLLDHVIIADEGYYSLQEQGELKG